MNRIAGLIILVVIVSILILLMTPGCDTLVTEISHDTVTIAGHPIAEFTVDTTKGCAPFKVTFLDLSNGPRDQWTWNFGDGIVDSLSGSNPIHIYDSAGLFTVRLTINDTTTGGSDWEEKPRYIVVGRTIIDFSVTPTIVCSGDSVRFAPQTSGQVNSWTWDFGDGSVSTDSTPVHVYDSIGIFSVSLTISGDSCGQAVKTDTNAVTVGDCPTVLFYADTLEGCAPFTVSYFDTSVAGSTQAIQSRAWDFGDSATSTEQNPIHVYQDSGLFTVTLAVTSTGGTGVDSIVDYITVWDSLTAGFDELSPVSACYSKFQQFQIKFADTSKGQILSRTWDFGDGTTLVDTAGSEVVHAYLTPGKYTVELTVDGLCGVDTTSDTLTKPDLVVLSDSLFNDSTYFSVTPGNPADTSTDFIFSDTSRGVIAGWNWDFGDNKIVDVAVDSVSHKYDTAGVYIVVLTISNDCGQAQSSGADTIIVTAQ